MEKMIVALSKNSERGNRILEAEKRSRSLVGTFDISSEDFSIAFPYHICFDKDLLIEHCGHYIKTAYPQAIRQETRVTDILELVHPEASLMFMKINL
ncbi:hypothetical protein OSTOST_00056 [Ostertagia ostertagi]